MATPLVTPIEDVVGTELEDDNGLRLPASSIGLRSNAFLALTESAIDGRATDHEVSHNSTTLPEAGTSPGYERGELWRPSGHMPFSLDGDNLNKDDPQRRNSAESFEMFSSSTDSQSRLSKSTSIASRLSKGEHKQEEEHIPISTTKRDDIRRELVQPGSPSVYTRLSLHGRLPEHGEPELHTHEDSRVRSSGGLARVHPPASVEGLSARGVNDDRGMARSFSDSYTTKIKTSEAHLERDLQEEETLVRVVVPSSRPYSISIFGEETAQEETTKINASSDDDFIASDFLEMPEHEQERQSGLVNASEMLHRLLVWYADRGDSQMAATLLLLAIPLLAPPGTLPTTSPTLEDEIVDAAYLELFNSQFLAFASDDANDIISNYHRPLELLNISPLCAESILSTYHEQLLALSLLNPATYLRRLAYPAFPSIYEQGLKDVEIGLLCKACKSPIFNHLDKLCCETCNTYQAACAVCWSRESPFELSVAKKKQKDKKHDMGTPVPNQALHTGDQDAALPNMSGQTSGDASTLLMSQVLDDGHDGTRADFSTGFTSIPHSRRTLYSTCSLCNHSIHAACSTQWYLDPSSGGACPEPGCLCACVRGRYREERVEAMEREERRLLAERAEKEELRKESMNAARGAAELGRVRSRIAPTLGTTGEITRLRGALKTSTSTSGQEVGSVEGEGRTSFEAKRVRVLEPRISSEV